MARYGSRYLSIVLCCCALLAAGCAGTAKGLKQSVYQPDDTLSLVETGRSDADAMVIIRYPAVIDADAQGAYYSTFSEHAIGGAYKPGDGPRQESDRIALAIVAKSNYFAMSLFRELSERLPADSVLLSPHLVELDGEGNLVSRPLLAAEQIPSVLMIDFSVYSHPDSSKMMGSPPLTFGDLVTPLITVHSGRWLRPSTHGLLLSTEPLLGAAWAQAERQADRQLAARLAGGVAADDRPLDFVHFLDRGPPDDRALPLKSPDESRREVVAVETHPLEKIRMDGEQIAQLPVNHAVDPFAEDFVKGAATRVVAALNGVDHDRATFLARQAALARFDPQLGEVFLSHSAAEDVRARLHMAEALVAAERKFLAAQSASLYAGAYDGPYGDQMRQMLAGEYWLLEDRRDLARKQNVGTALAILALAGAVYIGSNTDGSNFFESSTMGNILLASSVWGMSSAFGANAESKTIGENFLAQMAPAITNQVTVQVEWLESRETISARDFGAFREQTLALYQRSVRSVAAEPVLPCAFGHPAVEAPGRWFGACAAGQASGSGYGVAIDPRGYSVEYLGAAADGRADGSGAMILRTPGEAGAVLFEGGFSEGLPDGVVKVEEPGRKPRVREYRAGKDRGAASADDLPRPRF
ncbi:MAG: hypothetical protein ACSLE2_14430 [Lysobacterales bacterium]